MRISTYLCAVARLSRADLEAALSFVGELSEHEGTELFPRQLLSGLTRLIPADGVGWQERNHAADRVTFIVEEPEVRFVPAVWEELAPLVVHDPLRACLHVSERRVAMLSDFLPMRAVRRNPFWSQALRTQQPWGGPYHLRVWFDVPAEHGQTIFLVRGGRDFSERDRCLLELLRPHLVRLRANVELRRRAVLEAPDGLDLTARELEVVRWVARGKTNAEIAALLYISPGTVRRHMDNIFSKLGLHTRTAVVARTFPRLANTHREPAS
jgi:DNA-binding CsgD family transcriptional regulator